MNRNRIVAPVVLGLLLGSLPFTFSALAAPARGSAATLAAPGEAFLGGALQAAWRVIEGLFGGPAEQPAAPAASPEPAAKSVPLANSGGHRRVNTQEGCLLDPDGKPRCT